MDYITIGDYWKNRFGTKVWRVSLNPGFGCPNREAGQGCAFCDPASFAYSEFDKRPVREQLNGGISSLKVKGVTRFCAYLQSGTNTYASVAKLEELFETIASSDMVVALCIGTRPDCLPDEILDLIARYNQRFDLWLEIGLQSANDNTLARLNRGHTYADFASSAQRAQARGIKVCAHVILGLPGESPTDEQDTALKLKELGVQGLKLHQLSVVRGTRLEDEYNLGLIKPLLEDEYLHRAVMFIQAMPGVVVHRFLGDSHWEGIIAPKFDKGRVIAKFTKLSL